MIQQLMTLLSVLKICVHFYSYKYYVMWDLMNDWIYMYWREVNVFGVDMVNVKQKLSYSSSSVFKNKIRSTKFDISCKFIYFLSHLLLVLEAVLIRDYQRFHLFIILKIFFSIFFFILWNIIYFKWYFVNSDKCFGVNLLRMCFWKPRSMLVWFSAVYTDEYLFKTESALWFNLYCCLLITWPYSRSFDSSGIVIGLYITAFNFCSFCLPTKVQKWLCK